MNTARLDLSDPALKEAIAKVRSDDHPATSCVFGYEGKAKIVCKSVGEGKCFDCLDDLEDSEVSYALLRVANTRDQESKTVKFVFICYVGPSVGGMQRGRVGGHKGDVKEMVGQSHVDIQTDDKDEISEQTITDKLKKASGANYDLGSNAGGTYQSKAGEIGKSAAAKYKELEKGSNIGPVIFDKYKKDKNVRKRKRKRAMHETRARPRSLSRLATSATSPSSPLSLPPLRPLMTNKMT